MTSRREAALARFTATRTSDPGPRRVLGRSLGKLKADLAGAGHRPATESARTEAMLRRFKKRD
jgi:hypothetical protein